MSKTSARGEAPAPPLPETKPPPRSSLLGSQTKPAAGGSARAVALRALQQQDDAGLFRGVQLERLTRGEPFAPALAKALAEISGAPLTKAGLLSFYQRVLPGTRAVLTEPEHDNGKFEFMISWLDNNGREVSRLGRGLRRNDDGSLELHSHSVWVDPAYRGRAVSAKVMEQEIELVRALGDHPKSCLSLRAGGMRDINAQEGGSQNLGAYAWANLGFDFMPDDQKPFLFYGKRCEEDELFDNKKPVLELLRSHFATWVDKQVKAGALPDDPALVQGLKAASDKWQHAWEISSFHVPGLEVQVPIGEQQVRCQLGKAFLTSEDSVNWDGVFYVSDSDSTQAKLGQAYRRRACERADRSEQEQRARLLNDLQGGDDGTRRAALEQIGAQGDAAWRPLLEQLRSRQPELSSEIDGALARLDGGHRLDHQRAILYDPEFEPSERLGAVHRMVELLEQPDPALLQPLFESAQLLDRMIGFEALRQVGAGPRPKELVRAAQRVLEVITPDDERRGRTLERVGVGLAEAGDAGVELLRPLIAEMRGFVALRQIKDCLSEQGTAATRACAEAVEARLVELRGVCESEADRLRAEIGEIEQRLEAVQGVPEQGEEVEGVEPVQLPPQHEVDE